MGKGSEQLVLSIDDVLTDALGKAGARLLGLVNEVLRSTGEKQGDSFASEIGMDPAQLSRALNGKGAHFPLTALPNVLHRDRDRRIARYVAAITGGEWAPRRQLTVEERIERLEKKLREKDCEHWIADAYGEIP